MCGDIQKVEGHFMDTERNVRKYDE